MLVWVIDIMWKSLLLKVLELFYNDNLIKYNNFTNSKFQMFKRKNNEYFLIFINY